jgi:hypothetical protein
MYKLEGWEGRCGGHVTVAGTAKLHQAESYHACLQSFHDFSQIHVRVIYHESRGARDIKGMSCCELWPAIELSPCHPDNASENNYWGYFE